MSDQAINTEAEITTQIAALQAQLEAVDDAIGAAAINWRHAAADPKLMEQAAERLTVLERRRDLLRTARGEAQRVLSGLQEAQQHQRMEVLVSDARGRVQAALAERSRLGRDLADAVELVGTLVQELYDQGKAVAGLFSGGGTPFKVSGLGPSEAALCVNTEDMHFVVNQVLGVRLGMKLWPQETNLDSLGIQVADRIERRECGPLRAAFEQGLRAKTSQLQTEVKA